MPTSTNIQIGTVSSARALGYSGWRKHIYAPCSCCGVPRWTEYVVGTDRPRNEYCKECMRKIAVLGLANTQEYIVGTLVIRSKVCSRCGKNLPLSAFRSKPPSRIAKAPASPSHKYYSVCRNCCNELSRDYRHIHPSKPNPELRKRRRIEIREFTRLLKQFPCSDCGHTYPFYVMHFDHRDSSTKVSNATTGCESWSSLIRELAKCDLVCANCHQSREWLRGSYCNGENYSSLIVDAFQGVRGLVLATVDDWVGLFYNPNAYVQWISEKQSQEIVAMVHAIASRRREA